MRDLHRLKRRARSTSIVSFGRPGSVAPLGSGKGGPDLELDCEQKLESSRYVNEKYRKLTRIRDAVPDIDARQSQAGEGASQKSSLVPSTGKFLE